MTPRASLILLLVLLSFSTSCRNTDPVDDPDVGDIDDVEENQRQEDNPLLVVEESESWEMPGLSAPVYVLRTEGNIPHIYGENEVDTARVHGFVVARDRFFMMDLTRRLGLGTAAALLGQDALGTDIGSRMMGSHVVAERIVAAAPEETRAVLDAFADGINYYITQAEAGLVPFPSEVDLAWQLLGKNSKAEMLEPFSAVDVAGMLAIFIYQTSYSGSPLSRTLAAQSLDTLFDGERFEELRRAGAREDIWGAPHPIFEIASGQWGPVAGLPSTMMRTAPLFGIQPSGEAPTVEAGLLERLEKSFAAQHDMRGYRSAEKGFGSNAWAVSGAHTPDGASLMAADGHLALGIPSILYNVGIDTDLLGQTGHPRQLGMVIPGIPYIALGTNGNIAWAFTQLIGDVTDWYVEELRLDADGLPAQTLFDGQWHDLSPIDEDYEVAHVQVLSSPGRTETWTRWETFDGRWLMDIEGTPVGPDFEPEPGQSVVRTFSGWVVPEDVDGDGTITAVSFTYAAHQMDDLMGTFRRMAYAEDVLDFRHSIKGMLASSFNFVASDNQGDIFYAAFQGTPCRTYLPRDEAGMFIDGANPTFLLDGTLYGRFTIPFQDGLVDDSHTDDPYRCVIPLDESPQAYNPSRGFVLTANNDPAGISFDRNIFNDPWYIGGPWYPGFRAETIDRHLRAAIADNAADIDAMARLQGNVESPLGRAFVPHLLEALDLAEDLHTNTPTVFEDWQQRLFDDYSPRRDQLLEARSRLSAWSEEGFQARSGVETFYHSPTARDRDDAIATMIFNAYLGAVMRLVLDDENIPDIWQRGGGVGRVRLLHMMLNSRGENTLELASFNEETGESVFFDNRHTEHTERSDELMVRALIEALDFLESESSSGDEGGFGTADMDQWLWGLRHQVMFESLLGSFLSGQPALQTLIRDFSITTRRLPLAENLDNDDPRRALTWFPRDGDQYAVDASNPGLSGTNFRYRNGPVMRMVVSLSGDLVTGQNIIPGGQSGLVDSLYFDDQAALWLGNQTFPMRFHVDDVIAGATVRETFR